MWGHYAKFNWVALSFSLAATILGAIALGTAWYQVADDSNYTIKQFYWKAGEFSIDGQKATHSKILFLTIQ
jgi:hypothetical protein